MKPNDERKNWTPSVPPFSVDTVIEDIICSYPEDLVHRIFDEMNLHCFNCVVGPQDTLRDVARLHELDEDSVVEQLSRYFADKAPLDEPSYYG